MIPRRGSEAPGLSPLDYRSDSAASINSVSGGENLQLKSMSYNISCCLTRDIEISLQHYNEPIEIIDTLGGLRKRSFLELPLLERFFDEFTSLNKSLFLSFVNGRGVNNGVQHSTQRARYTN